jgi:hypothetical protein
MACARLRHESRISEINSTSLLCYVQVTKQSLPSEGVLSVTFVAKHKFSREAAALSEPEFHSLWTQQVQPRCGWHLICVSTENWLILSC